MKRKNLRKKVAAVLALIMAVNISACGNSGNTETESPGTQDTGTQDPGTGNSAALPDSGEEEKIERQTITVSTVDINAGENNSGEYAEEIFQAMEDFTGVDVELVWTANDVLAEKNSLYPRPCHRSLHGEEQ